MFDGNMGFGHAHHTKNVGEVQADGVEQWSSTYFLQSSLHKKFA